MAAFPDEVFVSKPVHQKLRIHIEPRRFYPQAVWELISLHITYIIESNPNIEIVRSEVVQMRFGEKRWFHQRTFYLEFEVENSQSMFDHAAMTEALYAFFFTLEPAAFGSDFEKVDKE